MRDYGKVSPQFWTGETGRQLRSMGKEVQLVALYLLTCPSANWIGLYYMALPTLCHEIGLKPEGALKALRRLSEANFASFDADLEHVFVVEMAAHQIGGPLLPNDNRNKRIVKDWLTYSKSPFFMDFYRRYKDWYHLPEPSPTGSPLQAPSKPLRSQEQEMDVDCEQEHESEHDRDAFSAYTPTDQTSRRFIPPSVEEVAAYCRERKNSIDAQRFVDFYTSKGWKIGKNAMKDWQAAVRNWEATERERRKEKPDPADDNPYLGILKPSKVAP